MSGGTPLLAAAGAGLPEMIDRLRRLVTLECGSYCKEGIDTAGRLVRGWLDALGFACTVHPRREWGDLIVARRPAPGPRLLLISHLDTVFPCGAAAEVGFRVEGDRAWGLGILDAKSGLVAALAAIAAVDRLAPRAAANVDLTLFINTEQELMSPNVHPLAAELARAADLVGVLEAARPGGEYVTGRRAVAKATIRVQGREAHAGVRPEDGANAIVELAHQVARVETLARPAAGLTLNVGVIAGGGRVNVVPAAAQAEVDLRAWTLSELDGALADLKAHAEETRVAGTSAEVAVDYRVPPMGRTAGNLAAFALLAAAAAEVGVQAREVQTGAYSDGNYAARHAPVLDGLGAVGGGPHTRAEFIDLPTLVERTAVLAVLLARLPDHATHLRQLKAGYPLTED